jgi:branched-chain amino acid transport system substrate-binding protein
MRFLSKAGSVAAASIAATVAFTSSTTLAQNARIKIGVILSTTGPAASLGIPEKNTIPLLPANIGGAAVDYIVVDDGTDTSNAVRSMRRLVTEDEVDAVIGSTVTPSTIAMTEIAFETKTPVITLAAAAVLINPIDDKRRWIFKTPQNDSMMAAAIIDHWTKNNIKKVGFLGFSDALGQSWLDEMTKQAAPKGIELVGVERFARTDTSVVAQILKLMAAKPDAIFIAAYGAPAALPAKTLKERSYAGKVYQTHGVGNADFLRIGGRDVEGTVLPLGPVVVASQLADGNPIKKVALDYISQYEAKYGAGTASAFGGYAFDVGLLLGAAAPEALKTAKPGTAEFRAALRDALESVKNLVTTTGIVTMSPTDHLGLDERARLMAVIKDGKWELAP